MTTHPLTEFRKAEGLTLEAFAEKIGASKSMVWKWENGEAEPRPIYRQKIVAFTDGAVTAADLLMPVAAE